MPGGGGVDTLIWMGHVLAIWQYSFFNRGEYWRGGGWDEAAVPAPPPRWAVPPWGTPGCPLQLGLPSPISDGGPLQQPAGWFGRNESSCSGARCSQAWVLSVWVSPATQVGTMMFIFGTRGVKAEKAGGCSWRGALGARATQVQPGFSHSEPKAPRLQECEGGVATWSQILRAQS